MRWTWHVAREEEGRGAYGVLVGIPKETRPTRGWEDNIKMDLQEVGWRGRGWIDLAQDRDNWRGLVNAIIKLRVP